MKNRECSAVAPKSKKEEKQNLQLPKDIIFAILTRSPAKFLHDNGRNVCPQWADLLNCPKFIESHHNHSNAGLLIQYEGDNFLRFFEVDAGNAELTDWTREYTRMLISSCHGITLFRLDEHFFSFPTKRKEVKNLFKQSLILYVANMVTKQSVNLPSAKLDSNPTGETFAAIGYDCLRKEFKVICFNVDKNKAYSWLFCTVSKDEAWRKVDISSHISRESFVERMWISAGGEIYGVYHGENEHAGNIIAVDVGDETTWVVNVPKDEEEISGGFIEKKNMLIHITYGRQEETTSVFQLDDFRQSAWVKMYKFQIHPSAHSLLKQCHLLAWVENGKLILFRSSTSPVVGTYNIRTGRYNVRNLAHVHAQICVAYRNLIVL